MNERVLQEYDWDKDRWTDVPEIIEPVKYVNIHYRAFLDHENKIRIMTTDWSTWPNLPRGGRWLTEEMNIQGIVRPE